MVSPKSLYLFFLCFTLLELNARTHFSDNCKRAYYHMLNLEYEKADSLLATEQKSNPDNLFIPYFKHYNLFANYYVKSGNLSSKELFNAFEQLQSQVRTAENRPGFWTPYFIAEMQLQEALLELNEQNYLSGFFKLRNTYLFAQKTVNEAIITHPAEKTLAITEALFSAIPEQYQWVLRLLSIDASLIKSRQKLDRLAEYPLLYFQQECVMMRAALDLHLGGEAVEALEYLKTQKSKSHNPLFYNYLLVNTANFAGQNDTALSYFEKISLSEFNRFPFLYFLKGKLLLQKLQPDARKWLLLFLEKQNSDRYKKTSLRYLSWSYLVEGEHLKAREYQNKIKETGNAFIEADKVSQKYAEDKALPDPLLIESRLLFDGGYYKQCLNLLLQEQNTSLEYTYRLARSYHELEDLTAAIAHYRKVLELSSYSDNYFAPNSALLLGNIFQNKGAIEEARLYYNKVFEYEDYAYEMSLEQKAKSALREIGK